MESFIITICSFFTQGTLSRKPHKTSSVLRLIEEHFAEDISLTGIAEIAGMNPDYLGRLFKDHTGLTFVEYVTWLRIKKSRELLKNPGLRVKDVGNAVGYANCNYFIKVFKGMTGMTPKEYKNNALKGIFS